MQYFGAPLERERADRFLRVLELERMHAARSDGTIVGGAGAFSFELSVPGGRVPTAGVTVVGVYPTHRRRGVLRAMMRAQLDDVRKRGEPLAALWASEETIYGRFGYGVASLAGEITLASERSGFALPGEPAGTLRFVDAEEARKLFPPVWERVAGETPGFFSRSPSWWELRILADPEDRREGGGPKRLVVLEADGGPAGYAIYRHHPSWDEGVSTARLNVLEAIAVDAAATRTIWRYLLDVDWVATVTAYLLPPDHPLFLLLAELRRLRYRMGDGLWVRLVDVGAALSARSYAADGAVVFEVADAFCPWNEGRWRLEDGEATSTDAEPDLRLDVAALGSVFLGGFSFRELQRAGRVVEARDGGVERADRLFATPLLPWCPEIF